MLQDVGKADRRNQPLHLLLLENAVYIYIYIYIYI